MANYTLFGVSINEGDTSEDSIKRRWTPTISQRYKYLIGAWMKSGYFDYFLAKAAAFARCCSNTDLDPTIVGDGGHGFGIWQWDIREGQNIVKKYVDGGYLPNDIPLSPVSATQEYFKSGKVPFETQIWAGIKYNGQKHIKKEHIDAIKKECGNDLSKTTICMAGLISYGAGNPQNGGSYMHFKSNKDYHKKGKWARVFNEMLEAEGGQSAIPNISEGDALTNAGFSSDGSYTVSGGGGGGVYMNVYGQSYGIRTIKEGEANTVYKLETYGERANVLIQNTMRKKEFNDMVNEMVQQVPNRERDIIVSTELYNSSIMKTTQSSKQERKVKR